MKELYCAKMFRSLEQTVEINVFFADESELFFFTLA